MDWERVAGARRWARAVLVVAIVSVALPTLLFVAQPDSMGGPIEPAFLLTPGTLFIVAGIGGMLVGFAGMWRIYRAPTRLDEGAWRYRDH